MHFYLWQLCDNSLWWLSILLLITNITLFPYKWGWYMNNSLLWVFATQMMIEKKKKEWERERKDSLSQHPPWRNHQHHLPHSFKKEAIIAIWQLCSVLNRSRFKGADLASCLALRTLCLFWWSSFVCMPPSSPLIFFFFLPPSLPFSVPLSPRLFLVTFSSPIVNQKQTS